MHEMAILEQMMHVVDGVREKEGVDKVYRITLQVGNLSGIVPAYCYDCWEAIIPNTDYDECELVINEVTGTLRCLECETDFPAEDLDHLFCPSCGSRKIMPMTGRDMLITEILTE